MKNHFKIDLVLGTKSEKDMGDIFPAVVWYKIPVLKDNKIYTKREILKEFDNQHDADYLVLCTPLSYAGMVGWSYKEEFDKLYKDKLYAI
jgi:hypothetical protein